MWLSRNHKNCIVSCACESFDGHNKNDSVRIAFHVFICHYRAPSFLFPFHPLLEWMFHPLYTTPVGTVASPLLLPLFGVPHALYCCLARRRRCCVCVYKCVWGQACPRASVLVEPLSGHSISTLCKSTHYTAISNCFDYYYFSLASEILHYLRPSVDAVRTDIYLFKINKRRT